MDTPHVRAAYTMWRYARTTAAAIFPSEPIDRDARRLLEALVDAGYAGLTATEIGAVCSRHRDADQLRHIIHSLEGHGLAVTRAVSTGGLPQQVTMVTAKGARSEEGAEAAPDPYPLEEVIDHRRAA